MTSSHLSPRFSGTHTHTLISGGQTLPMFLEPCILGRAEGITQNMCILHIFHFFLFCKGQDSGQELIFVRFIIPRDSYWYQKCLHIVMLRNIEQVAGNLARCSRDPGSGIWVHGDNGQLGRTRPEQDQLWLGPWCLQEGRQVRREILCHSRMVLSTHIRGLSLWASIFQKSCVYC